MVADITVFDPAAIADHATFANPNAPSSGVTHVIVNGTLAFRDGAPTGARGGHVLLRGPHEPSRPMRTGIARRMSGRVSGSDLDVNLGVEQRPGQAPRGRLRVDDRTSQATFEMTEFGWLQVAPGWAAVTGRGRAGGPDRAFTVIVEQADPLDDRQSTTVTILGEDGFQLTRAVTKNALRVSPAR
jgi:N-acyl-D-amino-acid deacylase